MLLFTSASSIKSLNPKSEAIIIKTSAVGLAQRIRTGEYESVLTNTDCYDTAPYQKLN